MEAFIPSIDLLFLIASLIGVYFFLKGQLADLLTTQKELVSTLKEARASGSAEHQMMVDAIHAHQSQSNENQKEMIAALKEITDKMAADHLSQHHSNAEAQKMLVKIDTKLDSHVDEERRK